jgi:hypothetical protein
VDGACVRCGGSGYMPYPHIQSGICFRCWGRGVDPNDGSEWQVNPKAAKINFLAAHLTTVRTFTEECGETARADLMALYYHRPERFVSAIERIEVGEGPLVAAALKGWAAEARLNTDGSRDRAGPDG